MDDQQFPRQGYEDEPTHEPGTEFEDPFLGPDAAVSGSLEETQAALQSERDERDASIDDDCIARPWEDLSDTNTPLHLAAEMASELADYVNDIESLYAEGLPRELLTAPVAFNMLTGGILVGALQLVGVLVPTIRPQLEKLLDGINDALPTATAEEATLIDETAMAVARKRLAASGIRLVIEDELEPEFDAGNN